MRSALQMLGGVAVAGVVATGSTAFTATGVVTNAGASQFVGGTVSQNVTGSAALSTVAYHTDTPGTSVDIITLTFASTMAGRTITLVPTEGVTPGSSITCVITTVTAVCTPGSPLTDLTKIDVTVA